LEPAGIAMLPTDPQLKNVIENYIKAFEGTGLLEQLRKKWLEDGSWIAALP
jgi:polar amino acid transport system substrate-binding protein